jgi:hypothetical protein
MFAHEPVPLRAGDAAAAAGAVHVMLPQRSAQQELVQQD